MEDLIEISVITPLYRHEGRFVRQCLESLKDQTLRECEFILIDNGANSENKEIIEKYVSQDSRFRKICFEKNVGMGAALNRGLREAKGSYIGFLESDDYASPNTFSDLLAHTLDGSIDVVKAFFYVLDRTGNRKIENNFSEEECDKVVRKGECRGLIQGHVSHWSGIYKKEFLYSNNLKFNETPGGHSQDFGFMLLVYAFANSVYIIPRAYVTYRLYTGRHDTSYLNACMVDELELTLNKLAGKKIHKNIWEIIFLRVAPRLKMCLQTSGEEGRERIIRLIKFYSRFQSFKYFSKQEKYEIRQIIQQSKHSNFIHNLVYRKIVEQKKKKIKFLGVTIWKKVNYGDRTLVSYIGGLFDQIVTHGTTTCHFVGIPIVSKIDSDEIQSIRILGIPVYYRSNKFRELENSINKLSSQIQTIHDRLDSISNLCYVSPWFPYCVQSMHTKQLKPYKNSCKDKIIVIVGSGPTLNHYKQIKNAVHIGLNRSFEKKDLSMDYIFAWDLPNLMESDKRFYSKLKEYPAKKILGRFMYDEIHQVNEQLVQELNAITLFSSARHGLPMPMYDDTIHYDIEKYPLMDFGSVAFGGFHFALYAGARKIILVGIDNNLEGYFSSEHRQKFLQTKCILEGWKKAKVFVDNYYPSTEIISLNPVGLEGIFKDIYTQSYIQEKRKNDIPRTQILDWSMNTILQ